MTDQNEYNRKLIEEFRATRANLDWPFKGRPLLLLTTTGARSGERRTTPIMYMPDGDRLIVFASNAGALTHPAWYHNLMAHPQVTVEIGNETFDAIALVTEGAERNRIWSKTVELYPFFADHQAKITRQIPVVALERQKS
jgi:deazaflavin-dependent oxidoreductase (nitroreductase family)